MNEIAVQTKYLTEAKAEEFLESIRDDGFKVRKILKSGNSIKLKLIHAVNEAKDLHFQWNSSDKLMVLLRGNASINDFEKKDHNTRIYHKEFKAFKLLVKSDKLSNVDGVSLNLLMQQSDENMVGALVIEELYSSNIWYIYHVFKDSLICDCYANLNNNFNAEFGSVRFSDITEAFGLESCADDHKFTVRMELVNKETGFQGIINRCLRGTWSENN